MSQCLYYSELVQVDSIRYMNTTIITCRCHIITIDRVRHTTNLLGVQDRWCETLSHIQIPNGDWSIQMPHCCKAIFHCRWWATHRTHILTCIFKWVLSWKRNFVHLWHTWGVHWPYSFMGSNIKQKNLLICAYWDREWTILCHFNRVDRITWVTFQRCYLLPCLRVPYFYVFICLASWQQDQVVCRIEAHCSHDCLMTL